MVLMTSTPRGVLAIQLDRDGSCSVILDDGRVMTSGLDHAPFSSTSRVAASTWLCRSSQLILRTTRGDDVCVDLARQGDPAPLHGRPIIYLDQNHWSTLTDAIHQPDSVANEEELAAALHLIKLAARRAVVLPMSSAHMAETCQQVDPEQRYLRALTIARLSAGWQLRDPLDVRRFELRQALTLRYRQFCLLPLEVVTLEPDAVHANRDRDLPAIDRGLPEEARWAVHAIRTIAGNLDAMLDEEHVPMDAVPNWAPQFERFARFMAGDPMGPEIKRRRTHAKFIADLGLELPVAAHQAGVSPAQMSQWTLDHSEDDLVGMPALGLFREVLHEKLCKSTLRWEQNDLIDMMYLTVAGGYCDHVAAEKAHGDHISRGLQRLGRAANVYRNIRTLVSHI